MCIWFALVPVLSILAPNLGRSRNFLDALITSSRGLPLGALVSPADAPRRAEGPESDTTPFPAHVPDLERSLADLLCTDLPAEKTIPLSEPVRRPCRHT